MNVEPPMRGYVGSKLVVVEGLTGSGKSTAAHFIARQLQYNGIPATWIHEGEDPHPILIDVESNIENYMIEMRERWAAHVDRVGRSGEVSVVEACLFNNCIEFLLVHGVDRRKIIEYGNELQALIEPLNPMLVYLVQEDVDRALERNFRRRGEGFRSYVIEYATGTPLAQRRGWRGYEGMVMFWREFVAVTDELFQRYRLRKIDIDSSAGDWDACNDRILQHLSIPWIAEQRVSPGEAKKLVGVYRSSDRDFAVDYEDGELTIGLWEDARTRLIRRAEREFLAEGWHFEVGFKAEDSNIASAMRIGGRDVDYLSLVGAVAHRISV